MKAPLKTKQTTSTPGTMKPRLAAERQSQQVQSVEIRTADQPIRLSLRRTKHDPRRFQHPCSPHLQNPTKPSPDQRAVLILRLSAMQRRLPYRCPRSRLMRSPCTKATTKTRRASHGTVTVMRLVSVRWLPAITMLARANGSIYLVSG